MMKNKDTTVIRVSAKTPELVKKVMKKVAVMTEGEVLSKPHAIEYALRKFLEEE